MKEQIKEKQNEELTKETKKNKKDAKGITLIALVITIIVLLILAGISIAMLTGENGILNKATTAKTSTEIGEEKEKVELSAVKAMGDDKRGEITEENLDKELANYIGKRDVDYELSGAGPFTVKYIDSGRKYIVNKDGRVEEYVPVNGKYYDTDTDITIGEYPVTIPGGATISNIPGEYESVEDGLVIYITNEEKITDWSDTETIQKTYDQFVWIPVDKETAIIEEGKEITGSTNSEKFTSLKNYVSSISSPTNGPSKYPMAVKKSDGKYSGILYDFKEENATITITPKDYTTTSKCREPDDISDDSSNSTITESSLQEEYKTMIERVAKKGGFWVGRYETSNMSSSNFTTNPIKVIKGTTKGISTVTWYKMYEGQKGYKNAKLANSETTSSMIWGSQWDQIMIWMREIRNTVYPSNGNYYITNSVGMGNYGNISGVDDGYYSTSAPAETGCFKTKNIYDLAGNVYDWSLEVEFTNTRVYRGGNYYNADASHTRASFREGIGMGNVLPKFGSRSTLY